MLIFNARALIAAAIGAAFAFGAAALIKIPILGVVIGLSAAMAVDIWMRYYSEDCEHPLIDPNAGGHVWFAPVWLVGIILMVMAGLMHFNVV